MIRPGHLESANLCTFTAKGLDRFLFWQKMELDFNDNEYYSSNGAIDSIEAVNHTVYLGLNMAFMAVQGLHQESPLRCSPKKTIQF